MREAIDYFKDWGPWGWVWAAGLVAFLLGLVLAPRALAGEVSGVLFLAAIPGALLMRAAGDAAMGHSGLETNI